MKTPINSTTYATDSGVITNITFIPDTPPIPERPAADQGHAEHPR